MKKVIKKKGFLVLSLTNGVQRNIRRAGGE